MRTSAWRPHVWISTIFAVLLIVSYVANAFHDYAGQPLDKEQGVAEQEDEREKEERWRVKVRQRELERKALKECWEELPKGLATRDFTKADLTAEECVKERMKTAK